MILYKGNIYDNSKQDELISSLKKDMYFTLLNSEKPTYQKVINACDVLYKRVINHEYDDIALPLLKSLNMPEEEFLRFASYFSKEGLMKKVEIELGDLIKGEVRLDKDTVRTYAPLGILFHIAAGNVDLLPSYSVIEGLLTGNINILKLPTGDNGLSVKLLKELIDVEPSLKDFIYVFDVPSTEVETIKQLSNLADATIVWGGETAAKAAREFVDIHSSLIIWGHKISFSYVDSGVTDEELKALAHSICQSNQLLCSSVQGIYVNSNKKEDLVILAERFLPIFAHMSKEMNTLPLTRKAKNTLTLYNEKLEGTKDIYSQDGVSITIKEDNALELSKMFQNIWIKPLVKEDIVAVLKPNKNLLQTVSINENSKDREEICDLLVASGVNKITKLGDNSKMITGENHDGEYPLRRYIKIVDKIKRA